MQISVSTTDRVIRQHGTSLGEMDGCVVEEVDDATMALILTALPDHGAGVTLSEDHQAVTPNPEPPHVAERLAAAEQRTADLAAVKAHAESQPDAHWQALARLVGAL